MRNIIKKNFYRPSKLKPPLLFDRLTILFLLATAVISFFSISEGYRYLQTGIVHIFICIIIRWMSLQDFKKGLMGIIRYCYPVVIIAIVHYEVEMFLHIFYGPGFNFDEIVKNWDALIFGNPHLTWHLSMPSLFWVELSHFFYMTYYPILIGGIIWVWKNRPDDIQRFAFVYLGIFFSFVAFYLLFPVFGPLEYRSTLFNETGYLPEVVDFLFAVGAPDGAAFPSSHVGQSVGVFFLLRPLKKEMAILISVCILGIAMSIIYISIHYAIDAAAGLISGWILYQFWTKLYKRIIK